MKGLIIVLIAFAVFPASGKDLKFAVVPKFYGVFFDQSKTGCEEAAAEIKGVECIYRGPEKADVRIQDKIIKQLINEGVDGIAVAVTQSDFLARSSIKKAREAGIPVVTYDSDFDSRDLKIYKNLRLAYIGTNNIELGRALGIELKKLRPGGGKLIIQSGRPDSPNLNLRIMGIRSVLSGKKYDVPPGDRLKNDNGWTEVRGIMFNFDQIDRSVQQMEHVLKGLPIQSDSFIAVGGWPQNDEQLYRNMIAPFKGKLDRMDISIVISDASIPQLAMLGDHLAHANIGQNPNEMGRQAIFTLYNIVQNKKYKKVIYTPVRHCTQKNYDTCTKSF